MPHKYLQHQASFTHTVIRATPADVMRWDQHDPDELLVIAHQSGGRLDAHTTPLGMMTGCSLWSIIAMTMIRAS